MKEALDLSGKGRSVEEFVRAERQASARQELIDGRLSAKPAANRRHNLIATNVANAVGSRGQGTRAEIYVNGMMVQLAASTVCYPDVAIVSGEPSFADTREDVLQNPTVVVEVFSGSENTTCKTRKLESYLAIASIRECLLIKADQMRIEHYSRQNAKQWVYRIYDERDDVISLDSIGVKVPLAAVYSQIKVSGTEIRSRAVN